MEFDKFGMFVPVFILFLQCSDPRIATRRDADFDAVDFEQIADPNFGDRLSAACRCAELAPLTRSNKEECWGVELLPRLRLNTRILRRRRGLDGGRHADQAAFAVQVEQPMDATPLVRWFPDKVQTASEVEQLSDHASTTFRRPDSSTMRATSIQPSVATAWKLWAQARLVRRHFPTSRAEARRLASTARSARNRNRGTSLHNSSSVESRHCGLRDALDTLEGVTGIGVARLDKRDVVRHPLVARIVEAYDQRATAEQETSARRARTVRGEAASGK